MADETCSVSEAMALLKGSLAGLGLAPTGIAIACCGGTRERSGLIAQRLVAGGFGRAVKPADRSVRYETGDGWFSWETVAEGDDVINFFYSLGADDRPVDYLVGEMVESPGPSPKSRAEERRENAPAKSTDAFREKAVPGDRAGGELLQAGGREISKSTQVHRLENGRAGRRENHPENRPVNRWDKAAPGWLFGGANSDKQDPGETPAVSLVEASPGGRGGVGHSLYPAADGAGPDQAGKTGQQASRDGNNQIKVRRRLF